MRVLRGFHNTNMQENSKSHVEMATLSVTPTTNLQS